MPERRTHHVTTTDGVTIGSSVHGQGPPLVFLQGVIGDGDLDWGPTVEHLADRFTCHLVSLRGRGPSDDHPDLSLSRLVEDVVEYVDSLGDRAGLTGWSGGGSWALAAASRCASVSAVAPFEPGMLHLLGPDDQALLGSAVAQTGELVAAGDGPAAARAFGAFPFTEQEAVEVAATGYFESAGRYAPHLMAVLQQAMASADPTSDPAVLGAIEVPAAVLVGSETKPFFAASAGYVTEHVPQARVHRVPGAAHAAPITHPQALAEALAEFFAATPQPV